jgi:hypothetical protein
MSYTPIYHEPRTPALTRIKHMGMDIAGSVAKGAGTLFDVGGNVYRTIEGEPNVEYGGPESVGAALERPFQHEPDTALPPSNTPLNIVNRLVGAGVKKGGELLERSGPLGQTVAQDVIRPASDIFQAGATVAGAAGLARSGLSALRRRPELTPSGAPAADQPLSAGAAEVPPDLSQTSPAFREQHAAASQRGPINREVRQRYLDAESIGVNLTEGAATRDPQLFSDEQNMAADPETGGHILRNDVKNDEALVNRLQEVRREAAPDVVARNNTEHGQQAVSDAKRMANDRLDAIDGAYQEARDAYKRESGGADLEFDGNDLLSKSAANLEESGRADFLPSSVQTLLNKIKAANGKLSFRDWDNGRSILAEEARSAENGNVRQAVSNVRDAYEKAEPIGASAQVKPLFDKAREMARTNFEDIEQNPAYKAVTEDTVPMKRVNGKNRYDADKDSPLSDSFIQKFGTGNGPGAARANILGMKRLMAGYPTFGQALESATLNNLRGAAGIDAEGITGTKGFSSRSYGAARGALEPKADALLSPESAAETAKLARVAHSAKEAPPGEFINRPKTAIVANRMALQPVPGSPSLGRTVMRGGRDLAINVGLAKTTGLAAPVIRQGIDYLANKRAMGKQAALEEASAKAQAAAKEEYARHVTTPGIGLNYVKP